MIEIFAPLIAALNALRDSEKRPAEERRKFFNEHIEPVHKRMEEIHNDYTAAFLRAIAGLSKRQSLAEVVDVLRAERPIALAKRSDARNFLKKLAEERTRHRPIKKDEPFNLFYSYVESIESYLSAASPLTPGQTWYGYFIDTFANLVKNGQDPFRYDKYAIAGYESNAPDQARIQLTRAVEELMPEAWSRLSVSYAALKARFLS